MKMTLAEALEAIHRGETPEQYEKRVRKIRRLSEELFDLRDALDILDDESRPRTEKDLLRAAEKRARMQNVKEMLERLS